MREVLDELLARWEAGQTIGMGTVVATFQSAPRPPGASMLVTEAGDSTYVLYGTASDDEFALLAQSIGL